MDPLLRSHARHGHDEVSEEHEFDVVEPDDPDYDDDGSLADARVGDVRPTRGWRREWRRWRRARRRVAGLVVVLLLPVVWSYGRALTGPGTDSGQARTVEWARDNHLGWAVDRMEKWWFAHHQAKIGGAPNLAARPAGLNVPISTATSLPWVPGHLRPPVPLVSPASPPVVNEGQWTPFGPVVNGVQGAYITSIRPDAIHTSVLDAVVWFDPTVLSMRQYPGLKIPGSPWDRPPKVEVARQPKLVAAFSGGFRIRDSNGGMILGHRTLQPMRVGGATFAIDDNGMPNIGGWGIDIRNSPTLDSARQSLDLILLNGHPAPDLTTDANRKWGFTGPKNKSAVWRSGAGIRDDGSLVWVGGDGLTVESLAEMLQRAGAIRGMQLDINQEWVQLNTYTLGANGAVHGRRLLHGMQHTGDRWLSADTRDFIAVFARES